MLNKKITAKQGVIGLVIFLVICWVTTPARTDPSAPQKVETTVTTSTFEETPFDLNATKLHPKYLGHFCESVASKLNAAQANYKKDEFETTEAFNLRMANLPPVALSPTLNAADILSFQSLPIDTSSSYDADTQKLLVTDSWSYSDNNFNRPNLKILTRLRGGSGTSPSKESFDICAMSSNYGGKSKFEISLPPEQAKLHKDHLRVLYVGKLKRDPKTFTYSSPYVFFQHPTPYVPDDLEEIGTQIDINLLQIWVFDQATGEVLAKQIVDQPKPEGNKHDKK